MIFMRLLLLRIEGPLQSWGENSKWDDRDTSSVPTKSGIIGLISCCMGLQRDDRYILNLQSMLSIAIRADIPGLIGVDYQTIKAEQLMNANGKYKPEKSNTIISHRQYIQDASYLVVISSPDNSLLDKIDYALKHPHWVPYLGRKSCVPTVPLIAEDTSVYMSIEEALCMHPFCERAIEHQLNKYNQGLFHAECDSLSGEYTHNDCLINTEKRAYSSRSVKYLTIQKETANVSITTNS